MYNFPMLSSTSSSSKTNAKSRSSNRTRKGAIRRQSSLDAEIPEVTEDEEGGNTSREEPAQEKEGVEKVEREMKRLFLFGSVKGGGRRSASFRI
jgi:hypothetical protein